MKSDLKWFITLSVYIMWPFLYTRDKDKPMLILMLKLTHTLPYSSLFCYQEYRIPTKHFVITRTFECLFLRGLLEEWGLQYNEIWLDAWKFLNYNHEKLVLKISLHLLFNLINLCCIFQIDFFLWLVIPTVCVT